MPFLLTSSTFAADESEPGNTTGVGLPSLRPLARALTPPPPPGQVMLLHLLDMQERSSSGGRYRACGRPRSRSLRRPLVTANSVLHTLQLDRALDGSKLADQLVARELRDRGGKGPNHSWWHVSCGTEAGTGKGSNHS